jgi:hypothetical protein
VPEYIPALSPRSHILHPGYRFDAEVHTWLGRNRLKMMLRLLGRPQMTKVRRPPETLLMRSWMNFQRS